MRAADIYNDKKFAMSFEELVLTGVAKEDWKGPEALIRTLTHHASEVKTDTTESLYFHVSSITFEDGDVYVNTKIPPFYNPDVQCITTGGTWGIFSEIVRGMIGEHFIIEENEDRTIKEIRSRHI